MDDWTLIAVVWMAFGVITFLALFFFKVTAPFGRHSRSDWGPMVNNTFGWMIMELPSLIFLWLSFLYFKNVTTPETAYLPLVLWSIHYINRTFIFPLRLKNKQKQMPLIVTGSAILFNLMNGILNGAFLAKGMFIQSYVLMIIGVIIFFVGMFINIKSDNILLALRLPGESGYKIPKGFLYRRVSSPNFLGEILEWFGFFIVTPSLASLSFLIWTLANLIPRARDHHEWYLKKFSNYPKDRKVLIPWVW